MSYYNRYKNKRRGDSSGGGNMNNNNNNNSNGGMPSGLSASDAIFDLGKNKRVTVRQFRNINLIDIREYYLDSSTGEMKPGKKGISLTEDLYDELLKHRLNIDEALRRLGSKRPKTKMVRLLSDDEYEDDNNNDSNDKDKNGNDKNSPRKRRDDKSKSSNEIHDSEPRSKKKKPAPPTLLPHEENMQNAAREANATLIIPGAASRKQQEERKQKEKEEEDANAKATAVAKAKAKAEAEAEAEAKAKTKANESMPKPAPVPTLELKKEDAASNIDEAKDANSSDEEFAQSLEAEMNKADDDISEEE
ncbi:hypothetical protein SEUBUCD646_0M01810 [Saccharomyces eubayanus]|uniref:Transcriptional coactivator n=1 Tax=Saccharomyces pastorianus TaxID=27292 RepID=A0A6C1EEZ6_SACPS|nr:Transcriptional coactivator [Saccharomyces pastorianus]CAI1657821.1 hypothetical protein SEUBUCD646_0M01810 [Saccharomyces eubayanus]